MKFYIKLKGDGLFTSYLRCLVQIEDLFRRGLEELHHGQLNGYYLALEGVSDKVLKDGGVLPGQTARFYARLLKGLAQDDEERSPASDGGGGDGGASSSNDERLVDDWAAHVPVPLPPRRPPAPAAPQPPVPAGPRQLAPAEPPPGPAVVRERAEDGRAPRGRCHPKSFWHGKFYISYKPAKGSATPLYQALCPFHNDAAAKCTKGLCVASSTSEAEAAANEEECALRLRKWCNQARDHNWKSAHGRGAPPDLSEADTLASLVRDCPEKVDIHCD